jgi:hypothetical protein
MAEYDSFPDVATPLDTHKWPVQDSAFGGPSQPPGELLSLAQALAHILESPLIVVAPTGGNAALNLDASTVGGKEWIFRAQAVGQFQFKNETGDLIPMRVGGTAQNNLFLVGVEPDGTTDVADEVNITGNLVVSGSQGLTEQTAEPSDPAEGAGILWLSDGTGFGDSGDICAKSTDGGTTRKNIIHDHSAGSL